MYDYLEYVSAEGTELKEIIKTYLNDADYTRVLDGMAFAAEKHGTDKRKDGREFYQHPFTVAYYLAEYQLDADTLIAAILHDVAEDVEKVTIPVIKARYGAEVARLVDSVTKIETDDSAESPNPLTKEEQSLLTFRKLFTAMVKDVRVILIKLFDRLHNMRTLGPMRPASQLRSATESLDVYAPIAHRLGMWHVKSELETLSLQVVDPEAYAELAAGLSEDDADSAEASNLIQQLSSALHNNDIPCVAINPSPRNPYPIYKRSQNRHRLAIDKSLRLVIEVPEQRTCYETIGVIHNLWQPRVGKFDDYIASPRVNMYRALHSNVTTKDGKIIKMRVRTPAMRGISEIGVLARWKPFEQFNETAQQELNNQVDELFVGIQSNLQDADDVHKGILDDVLSEQIIVYSPLGDTFLLPNGSTPLDFAYRIHSDIGQSAYRASINEESASLNTKLVDGDRVEVHVRDEAAPQRSWLDEDLGYLHTRSAVSKVRKYFRDIDPTILRSDGRRLLNDELQMIGLPSLAASEIGKDFGLPNEAAFLREIGLGNLLTSAISTRLIAFAWAETDSLDKREIGRKVRAGDGSTYIIYNAEKLGDLRLCTQCNPYPGDPIFGYIRNEINITVHRSDCEVLPRDAESGTTKLRLDWGQSHEEFGRVVRVWIDAYDRPQLLLDITHILAPENVNIIGMTSEWLENSMRLMFEFVVMTPRQLVSVVHKIRALVNVFDVRCFPTQKPSDGDISSISNDF